jgi:hypothetical protein
VVKRGGHIDLCTKEYGWPFRPERNLPLPRLARQASHRSTPPSAHRQHRRKTPADLIAALPDELSRECVEIDRIKFSGPAFAGIDNRLMSLHLVERTLTGAAMFTASGEVVQPSDVLRKKPILVERGASGRPPMSRSTLAADGAGRRGGDRQGREPLRLAAGAGNVNDRMRTGVRPE